MNQQSIKEKVSQAGQKDFVNLGNIIVMAIGNWYYILLALVITIGLAFFYIKYATPIYSVTSMILIEEDNHSSLPSIDNNLLEGFGVRSGTRNLDNQMLILSSWSTIRSALEELPFEIDFFHKGFFSEVSLYPLYPIEITMHKEGYDLYESEFVFEHFNTNVFRIYTSPKSEIQLDTFISFGQTIKVMGSSFSIKPRLEFEELYTSKSKIYFKFYDQESLVESYQKRLIVENASKEGTIIRLRLQGTNKTKDIVFLEKLTEIFMSKNLEKKNHEALRIIEFIDEQLIDVSDSLMITEDQLENFRSKNRIMDISSQAQQIIDQAVELENAKAKLTLESNYYGYLGEYLSKTNNQEVPISPSTMGIEDPLLGRLMQELAGLQAEYFSGGVGERNPLQSQLELRIRNTKQSIRETLQGISLANEMALDENSKQIQILNKQAKGLPTKERQLLGIERKFNLNNVLYTFLLQKRAEAQIQKASNRSDNELVELARASRKPIAPNEPIIYLIAVIIGLVFPIFMFFLWDSIRNNISSEEEILKLTELPIVGHIPRSRLSYNTVVLTEPHSKISEAFRSLRTRLEFITKETTCPIFLITSSIPKEGKTFTAINLASAYSLMGKRTLLIGFDLRRPTLSSSFTLNEKPGVSSYLIGREPLERVIHSSGFSNLDIIPSGPIPPNPGELSSSEKALELFQILRSKYDFIIVDSAPLGVVSDSYSIATIADATLILIRDGITKRNLLATTLGKAQVSGIKGASLVVNGVRSKRGSYRYSYNNYNYKYKKIK